ncbi:uncharacterized protein LOC106666661 [Cimex lectularius]|uniref:DNA-3-methyladenine glycosylase n=1 Tax=Cimex lectularius TaxID=79782 RepID=A0A8I6RQW8_CIMLE|nr:uncharacterized protein LOC106666661 [Cimex lectularius]
MKCTCGGTRDELKHGERRLTTSDYDRPATELAKFLLGKVLVRRKEGGEEMKGIIVETEAYIGGLDKASHSYKGKKTKRNAPMFMKPGTAYVYITYGMYHCFNISSQGEGAAVLLRAIEPIYGINDMRDNKAVNAKVKKKSSFNLKKDHRSLCIREICNGPSKLCMALDIDKKLNTEDLSISTNLWVENNLDVDNKDIINCSRIGLNSIYGEWMTKPLRYYIKDNLYISKKASPVELAQML